MLCICGLFRVMSTASIGLGVPGNAQFLRKTLSDYENGSALGVRPRKWANSEVFSKLYEPPTSSSNFSREKG